MTLEQITKEVFDEIFNEIQNKNDLSACNLNFSSPVTGLSSSAFFYTQAEVETKKILQEYEGIHKNPVGHTLFFHSDSLIEKIITINIELRSENDCGFGEASDSDTKEIAREIDLYDISPDNEANRCARLDLPFQVRCQSNNEISICGEINIYVPGYERRNVHQGNANYIISLLPSNQN